MPDIMENTSQAMSTALSQNTTSQLFQLVFLPLNLLLCDANGTCLILLSCDALPRGEDLPYFL
jgi:hypothetical protein